MATPTRSISPPPALAAGVTSSASISSSASSVSLRPSRSKSLTPLYSGGLCEAEMTAPRSSARRATAGVGRTPASTALPPAETTPRANASSSSGPDARVSRPTKTRPPFDQSVTARPSRSTRSGVRSRPTTPRTPSVPKYRRAMRATLALGPLRRFARLLQPGLLPLHDPRVPREEARALERDPDARIGLDEGAGDAVPDGAGLPRRAPAVDAGAQVEPTLDTRDLERRQQDLAVDPAREVVLDRAAVDPRGPVAWTEDHARDRRLPLAGGAVVRALRRRLGHQRFTSSGCGA